MPILLKNNSNQRAEFSLSLRFKTKKKKQHINGEKEENKRRNEIKEIRFLYSVFDPFLLIIILLHRYCSISHQQQ